MRKLGKVGTEAGLHILAYHIKRHRPRRHARTTHGNACLGRSKAGPDLDLEHSKLRLNILNNAPTQSRVAVALKRPASAVTFTVSVERCPQVLCRLGSFA